MPTTAERQSHALSVAWWAAVGVTLAVLPFESRIHLTEIGGVAVTPLHLGLLAVIALWIALLLVERRLPALPASVAVALSIGLAGLVISAVLADGFNEESLRFVALTAGGGLLFIALVDMVRTERSATWTSAVLVAACAGSAVLGAVLLALPVDVTVNLLGQDHSVAGARRLQATFGYPNTAAVAFEAATFLAVGLLGVFRERMARLLIGLAVTLLVLATALTLSRGAVLGLASGTGTLIVVAWLSGHRRLAAATTAGGAAVLLTLVVVQLAALPIERLWTDSESDFYGATYEAPMKVVARISEPAQVAVTVTNTGDATWRSGDYQLGYHWLNIGNEIVAFGQIGVELGDVPRGGRAPATVTVPPIDNRMATAIAWDVYQVGGEWFSERGVPVAVSQYLTRIPTGPGPPPTGHAPTLLLYPALLPEPSRAELWGAAVAMIREAPLLGVGPGTFRLRYGAYLGWPEWDERIHANNTYLEIGATTGLVGVAVFLFVTLYAMWRQLRHLLARPPLPAWLLSVGLLSSAVAFAAHGVVDYFLGFSGTLAMYWAILGIGLGLALRERSMPTSHDR